MEITSFDDIRKLHENFTEQLAARMQTLATSATSGAVDPLGERRAQLEATQERIDTISAARDAAMQRFDDELARQQTRADELKRELADFESARRQAESPAASESAAEPEAPADAKPVAKTRRPK